MMKKFNLDFYAPNKIKIWCESEIKISGKKMKHGKIIARETINGTS